MAKWHGWQYFSNGLRFQCGLYRYAKLLHWRRLAIPCRFCGRSLPGSLDDLPFWTSAPGPNCGEKKDGGITSSLARHASSVIFAVAKPQRKKDTEIELRVKVSGFANKAPLSKPHDHPPPAEMPTGRAWVRQWLAPIDGPALIIAVRIISRFFEVEAHISLHHNWAKMPSRALHLSGKCIHYLDQVGRTCKVHRLLIVTAVATSCRSQQSTGNSSSDSLCNWRRRFNLGKVTYTF